MTIIMQAAYRLGANISVPAPVDKSTPDVPWWYDKIAHMAHHWAAIGVTHVMFPPALKTNAGDFPGADGYGTFDDYDIGSKNQFYSVQTRFGNARQLRRAIAICNRYGLDVLLDMVPHQRMGGIGGVYEYLGADGKTKNGRFAKQPGCFVGEPPRVPRDPVFSPSDDFGFGDELAPINSEPPYYVLDGLTEAGNWITRTLGADGYRLDDVKGLATAYVREWATADAMAGKYIVGECYDGNPATLQAWCEQTGWVAKVFDFTTHFTVEYMCNNTSRWNMEQLGWNNGFWMTSADHAVKFVENPDTDTDGFATVVWNKAQGYFWIATTPGDWMCYYKDWSDDPGCYGWGLQAHIENYMWIARTLANGPFLIRHSDFQTFVYERTGSPGLLCGINNDMYNGSATVTVKTNFGAGVQLHDYTGHSPDVWTDANGMATIALPQNDNGLGTVAYSRAGQTRAIEIGQKRAVQTFFCAPDLDIGPIVTGQNAIADIWVEANTYITFSITPDITGWGAQTGLGVTALAPDGGVISATHVSVSPTDVLTGEIEASALSGWYGIVISGIQMPAAGSSAQVQLSYLAAPIDLPKDALSLLGRAERDSHAEEAERDAAAAAQARRARRLRYHIRTTWEGTYA